MAVRPVVALGRERSSGRQSSLDLEFDSDQNAEDESEKAIPVVDSKVQIHPRRETPDGASPMAASDDEAFVLEDDRVQGEHDFAPIKSGDYPAHDEEEIAEYAEPGGARADSTRSPRSPKSPRSPRSPRRHPERVTYSMAWSGTAFRSKASCSLRLDTRVELIAHCMGSKDWLLEATDGKPVGTLVRRQGGARWSYYTPGRMAQVFGIFFTHDPETHRRFFRVALAVASDYRPTSKGDELSRLAQDRAQPSTAAVRILESKRPRRNARGAVVIKFGVAHVVPSIKNFFLEDQNGRHLFSVYKTSPTTCGVQTAQSMAKDAAFALGLSAVLNEAG